MSVNIIAEIGINHGGDYILAQEMVEAAFEAGANAAKFQIVNPEESYSKNNISYSVFSKAGLSDKQIYDLDSCWICSWFFSNRRKFRSSLQNK